MLDDFKPRRPAAPSPEPVMAVPPPEESDSSQPAPSPGVGIIQPLNAPESDELPPPQEPLLSHNEQRRKRFSIRSAFARMSKRRKIACCSILSICLVGAGVGGVFAYRHLNPPPAPPPPAPAIVEEPEPPKPTTEASRLTGVQIQPELNQRHVTGIMIENSPDARPQAGLSDAGVVFEAVAEGGITRFLALFMESQPAYIGPVRSARPYYLDFLMPFDAAYAHVGGSPEALAKVRAEGVKDMDQFHNAGAYWRESHRYAPHNMYTSIPKLDEVARAKGYASSTFAGFERLAEEAPVATPTAASIDIRYSSQLYDIHYDYDKASNSYRRVMGGQAHTDEKSGQQLAPKVVVALVMNRSQNGIYSVYQTTGTGQLYVFQNGEVLPGTWSKADNKSQFRFADEGGQPLKLSPGQTWVSIVAAASDVTHQP